MSKPTKTERVREIRDQIASLLRSKRNYEATVRHLESALDGLDDNDPENGDAARVWMSQLCHADDMANRAERHVMRLRNELADELSRKVAA